MSRIGIFLDRDGTIIEEVNYLSSPKELHLLPRSAEAIKIANDLGLKVIIATNQSGIARGILTEEQLEVIHNALIENLRRNGANIDGVYYCPHHPDTGLPEYRKDCTCRKPKPGMILQASKDFEIEISKSYLIGDKAIDVETASACGTTSILVQTGYGQEELKICRMKNIPVDYVAADLLDAIKFIEEKFNKEQNQNATIKIS
ncbi:MAG: HAD family hydrolase [Ignavibacteriales bacterium]|nr:HAD family hydrolase [Ignavibacteriales bacterium]